MRTGRRMVGAWVSVVRVIGVSRKVVGDSHERPDKPGRASGRMLKSGLRASTECADARLGQYSMVELRLRPRHWALLLGTLLVEIVAIGLSWGREPVWDTLLYAVYALANVIAGVLILARHPGHRIGWLLIATGLVSAIVSDFAQGWALAGTVRGWPGAVAADLVFNMSWPIGGVLMAATFVLFPDGSPPQQGKVWPWVLPLGCLGAVVTMAGWATGDEVTAGMVSGRNPLLSEAVPSELLFWSGLTALAASMILGALAMVLRMRQAHGVERQQLKWMVAAVSVVVFTLPFGAPLYYSFVWCGSGMRSC